MELVDEKDNTILVNEGDDSWVSKEPPPKRLNRNEQAQMCNSSLPRGTFVVGNGLYTKCKNCGKIVRVNKPILGDLHVCD